MTTDTEALRAAFEDYVNPEGDVALHWQPAGYYAGGGLQGSWLDFRSGYLAGHAAAKAETAEVGEPVAWLVYLPSEDGQRVYDDMDDLDMVDVLTNNDDAEVTNLYTTSQLAAAVAAERERIIRECIPGGDICDPQQIADAIRAGEPSDG